MSKMKELDLTLRALRSAASSISTAADSLAELFGDKSEECTNASETITLEQVKAVMTAKSREGKSEQMRALVLAHGAEKLSKVDPSKYAALLKEAEVL